MRVWLNGRLVPEDQAAVSVLDHGLTVGDGVFETLKVVDGIPFAVTRHIRRLRRSAASLGIPEPDPELVAAAMADTVAANLAELGPLGRLRVTLTSGPGPLGSDRGDGPVTLAVVAAPARPWPESTAVITVPWPRNERGALVGVKSTSYAENALALARAHAAGASEALLSNTAGALCEGTGSNVFVVRRGRVLTSPLASGCLAGITRELVLQWSDAVEEQLSMSDLAEADEVFLTSSTRDVQPVSRVDGRQLPVGERTLAIAADFARNAAAQPDP